MKARIIITLTEQVDPAKLSKLLRAGVGFEKLSGGDYVIETEGSANSLATFLSDVGTLVRTTFGTPLE